MTRGSRARLLCLIPNLNGGGAERVMLYLLHGLDRSEFDLTLGLAMREGHFIGEIPDDIRTIEFGHPRSYNAVPRLARMLRSGEYDLAFSMCAMNMAVTAARELSRAHVPLVLGARNHYSRCLPIESTYPGLRKAAIRALYPRAELVIGVAQGVCDDLVANFGVRPERARAIPNPLDLAKIRRLAAEDPGHPWLAAGADRPVVLNAGKLMDAKGHGDLLLAFRQVRDRLPARLLILGQGPNRAKLEAQIAELGLGADVALAGFQQNPYAWMARSTLFVLSSLWEGFPNVLTEAIATGAPVISTDCPSGPSEVLDDRVNGRLVPVRDPNALARAMLESLERPAERLRMRDQASRDVERYDLPRILAAYAAAFTEVRRRSVSS